MWNFKRSLRMATRMSSCFFSSRLKTRICATSVCRKRSTAAWPNEPVPPVMSTTLPLSRESFPDAGGALLTEFMHDSQHLLPSGGNIPGALAKAGRIERAVDHQLPVRHDLDRMPVFAGYAAQHIVLADGRRGDMIQPRQIGRRYDEI